MITPSDGRRMWAGSGDSPISRINSRKAKYRIIQEGRREFTDEWVLKSKSVLLPHSTIIINSGNINIAIKAHNYCSHIWQISPVPVSLWWCSKSHPMCSWNCFASLLFYSVREPVSVVVARKTWIIDYFTGPYPPHPPTTL